MDPIFWLGLSILLVAVSIAAVLLAAIPAMKELGRAAQSAEKLFDTLNRELPPTLEAIRLTSLEITELTDDLTGGVQGASNIVQQVDGSVSEVKTQAQQAKVTTKSVMAGVKAAWKSLTTEESRPAEDRSEEIQSSNPVKSPRPLESPISNDSNSFPNNSHAQSLPEADRAPFDHRSTSNPETHREHSGATRSPNRSLPHVETEVIQSRLAGYESNGHLSTSPSEAEIRLPNPTKPVESHLPVEE